MNRPSILLGFQPSETETVDRPAAALLFGTCTHVGELREVQRLVEMETPR